MFIFGGSNQACHASAFYVAASLRVRVTVCLCVKPGSWEAVEEDIPDSEVGTPDIGVDIPDFAGHTQF
jgi:hypothetical protein